MDSATEGSWGPLNTPIHDDDIPAGALSWKDNAYIAFWAPEQNIYGCLHVSTSPNNVEGRRARFSFYHDGPNVEIVEPLERGTFSSTSIDFDLNNLVTINHPRLAGQVVFKPRFAYADYVGEFIPALDNKPLRHYQISIEAEGDLKFDGRKVTFKALGARDRTWGFRDMSLNFPEYFFLFATFPTYSISLLRILNNDGTDRTDGFILDGQARRVMSNISITRDPSGLFASGDFTLKDGSKFSLRSLGRRAGFWLPMEWERKGPAMSAYDEFCPLERDDGTVAFGVVEHGNVRKLF